MFHFSEYWLENKEVPFGTNTNRVSALANAQGYLSGTHQADDTSRLLRKLVEISFTRWYEVDNQKRQISLCKLNDWDKKYAALAKHLNGKLSAGEMIFTSGAMVEEYRLKALQVRLRNLFTAVGTSNSIVCR